MPVVVRRAGRAVRGHRRGRHAVGEAALDQLAAEDRARAGGDADGHRTADQPDAQRPRKARVTLTLRRTKAGRAITLGAKTASRIKAGRTVALLALGDAAGVAGRRLATTCAAARRRLARGGLPLRDAQAHGVAEPAAVPAPTVSLRLRPPRRRRRRRARRRAGHDTTPLPSPEPGDRPEVRRARLRPRPAPASTRWRRSPPTAASRSPSSATRRSSPPTRSSTSARSSCSVTSARR